MKSVILKLHDEIVNKKKVISQIVEASVEKANQIKSTNSIINDCFKSSREIAKVLQSDVDKHQNNLLYGIPYAMKDNVSTKDYITTGGSSFLKNYLPPYDATIYEILNKHNSIMLCKSNLDEFGMGGTGLHTEYGCVSNVWDSQRIAGGSSSGSVNLVASGAVPFAIGTDTGDSIRRPATFTGTVGFIPTYGLISRYGVLPYAPSLDRVGVITTSVIDAAITATSLIKYDEKDFTSQSINEIDLYKNLKVLDKLNIGVIDGIEKYLDADVGKIYLELINKLNKTFHVQHLTIDKSFLDAIGVVYHVISFAEASSCWANLTGILFGENSNDGENFEEIIRNNRTKLLGDQVKKRLAIGSFITLKENWEKYYLKAKKVRRLLSNTWNNLLSQVDTILIPGASFIAPLISDINNDKIVTNYEALLFANFAGTPSISIPFTKVNKMPWGINLNCAQLQDQKLINVAYTIETFIDKLEVTHE